MSNTKITAVENGPLLVTGLRSLSNSKGPIELREKAALCRCGDSANKPFCDGAHVAHEFSSGKNEDRTPDSRDDYVGNELTVHDNRGACAHAGMCTDGLPTVWRMKEEPWIHPDSASADEVARVVRNCPSGALMISIDGVVSGDQEREPAIHIAKNGPYVVTGSPELVGEKFGEGVSTEHFTLCRCGSSKNKPFCDGAHWTIEFRDDTN